MMIINWVDFKYYLMSHSIAAAVGTVSCSNTFISACHPN